MAQVPLPTTSLVPLCFRSSFCSDKVGTILVKINEDQKNASFPIPDKIQTNDQIWQKWRHGR